MKYAVKSILVFVMTLFFVSAHAKTHMHVEPGSYEVSAKRWKNAANSATFDSDSWVWSLGFSDKYHKNGKRDTALIVPSTAVPDDVTLVIWFHGLGGFTESGFQRRIMSQLNELAKDSHSFALAIPEMPWSVNTTTPRGRQGRVWTKPGELERYVAGVRLRLEKWSMLRHNRPLGTVRIVFVGHSAGGSALMAAAKEGSLCRIGPEAIIWSDASYGYWLDATMNSCVKRLDTQLHILVRKWDKPHKSAERALKLYKRKPGLYVPHIRYQVLDRRAWSHRRIGDNALELTGVFPPGC